MNIHLDTLLTSGNVKFKHQMSTKFQFKISLAIYDGFYQTLSPFFKGY